jgi:hypothetical protein
MAMRKLWLGGQYVLQDEDTLALGVTVVDGSGGSSGGGSSSSGRRTALGGYVDVVQGANATPCTIDQKCLYAIVSAATLTDAPALNTAEVRAIATTTATMTQSDCLKYGLSIMQANFEGLIVPCANLNELKFATMAASARVRVIPVVAV